MNGTASISRTVLLGLIVGLVLPLSSRAGLCRTQTVDLDVGWNAVYLEVTPAAPEPAVVFTNTPIDIVAGHFAPVTPEQFMSDPAADMLLQMGWGVWYAPHRADAFLSNLHAIYGQKAFLVHATTGFTWTVTGTVETPRVEWQPDRYNLVGFGVDGVAGPSFSQFFAGSSAHQHGKIYRLQDGSWRKVANPAGETMRSGEAFWVYCDGSSKYMGPITVETPVEGGMMLGAAASRLTLRNPMPHPVGVTLEHVPSGDNAVPLSMVMQVLGTTNRPVQSVRVSLPDGGWTQPLPPLESGHSMGVPLSARLENMTKVRQESLLRVRTDLGTELWVPVVGIRDDLEEE